MWRITSLTFYTHLFVEGGAHVEQIDSNWQSLTNWQIALIVFCLWSSHDFTVAMCQQTGGVGCRLQRQCRAVRGSSGWNTSTVCRGVKTSHQSHRQAVYIYCSLMWTLVFPLEVWLVHFHLIKLYKKRSNARLFQDICAWWNKEESQAECSLLLNEGVCIIRLIWTLEEPLLLLVICFGFNAKLTSFWDVFDKIWDKILLEQQKKIIIWTRYWLLRKSLARHQLHHLGAMKVFVIWDSLLTKRKRCPADAVERRDGRSAKSLQLIIWQPRNCVWDLTAIQ